MMLFLNTIFSFPTIIFTFLMIVAMLFWLVSAVGLINPDFLDFGHTDAHCDINTHAHIDMSAAHTDLGTDFDAASHDHHDVGWFAGLLMRFGLDGVPLTIVLTVLFFCSWIICYFVQFLLLVHLPLGIFLAPVGIICCFIVLFPAAYIAGFICKPLRVFFKKLDQDHFATSAVGIVGETAIVRSGSVTSTFGEAYYDDKGAGLIIRIRADEALDLKKGDRVVMIQYDALDGSYKVVSEDEFTGL